MSEFRPAAWQVRRARVAQERWNEEHPERFVAWEWVKEALLSWRSWKEMSSFAPEAAEEALRRHEEFARKLPAALLDEVFPR